MSYTLSNEIQNQINNKSIKARKIFTIDSVDQSDYLLSFSVSANREFGSISAVFSLNNDDMRFGEGGTAKIEVGSVVELKLGFEDDTKNFPIFYGRVEQRSLEKTSTNRTIVINCLDYISTLQNWDIDTVYEGEKIEVNDETLVPNYLDEDNPTYAQVFDFANDNIAQLPPPILSIQNKSNYIQDPQFDGYEIYYATGQIKLGYALQANDNYDLICNSYYFYTHGLYVEDVIEDILIEQNGYGKYLFDKTTAQDFIDNHLVETFQNVEGTSATDTLTCNQSNTTITNEAILQDMSLNNTSGALNLAPIAHWKLDDDESGSQVVTDEMGTYDGTLYSAVGGHDTSDLSQEGKLGNCFNFNSNTSPWDEDYINVGSIFHSNQDNISIELWAKIDSISNTVTPLVENLSAGSSKGYSIWIHNTGGTKTWRFQIGDGSTLATLDYEGDTNLATWYHVVCTWEAGVAMKIYINGVNKATQTTGLPITMSPLGSGSSCMIGKYLLWYLDGKLDNIKIYNITLSEEQIEGLYASGNGFEDTLSWIELDTTKGFSDNGEGEINGDIFTWTSRDSTYLYGIPTTGSYSLNSHPAGSYVKYEKTYSPGQVWYLTYSRVIDDLTLSDLTIPSGTVLEKFDNRYGRFILADAISTSSNVVCNTNYSFYTIQATGIEINKISFSSRELNNRYEALNKIKEYLAPNYIIRTEGDDKIWASYLSQKTSADYDLELISRVNYMEDTDLYTRTLFYAKNINPTNIVFNEGVNFDTTGQNYLAYADLTELTYDSTTDGWHKFTTAISNIGSIILSRNTINGEIRVEPKIYIDDVPVDDQPYTMFLQPVRIALRTVVEHTTEVDYGWFGKVDDVDEYTYTYYHYTVHFAHHSINPNEDIILYSSTGEEVLTIPSNSRRMRYETGVYIVPGDSRNSSIESVATATYSVLYPKNAIRINYDNAFFEIRNDILPFPTESIIQASFQYLTALTPIAGIGAVIDGRWDTQTQTAFYSSVPSGYEYAILDLATKQTIQAIDIVGGFYKPTDKLKFDIDVRMSLQYSINGNDFYPISDSLTNFKITGGERIQFDEEQIGFNFEARYIKVILENVKKIDYKSGVWPVAFTEIAIYNDIILKSESKLVPITYLNEDIYAPTNLSPSLHFLLNDNGSNSTITELMQSGVNGTLYDGGVEANTEDFSVIGHIDKAINFDGNTYINCGNIGNITSDISVCAWVNVTNYDYSRVILTKGVGSYVYRFQVNVSDGRVKFFIRDNSILYSYVTTTYICPTGEWVHLCVVVNFTDRNIKFYVNGDLEEIVSLNSANTAIDSSAGDFNIGALSNGVSHWLGYLEDIRVYDTVLTQGDIDAIYYDGTGTQTSTAIKLPKLSCTSSLNTFSTSGTAYIGSSNSMSESFTYESISEEDFIGVEGLDNDHIQLESIKQELSSDTRLYDYSNLLEYQGDRLYKDIRISDQLLFTQDQLDKLSGYYLEEFIKNHSKINVQVLYAPYLKVGHTVALTDPYQSQSGDRYFIESITDNNGIMDLILAKYPA